MTLRLVSDNEAPILPIAEQAREFADELEAGKFGVVTRVAIVIEFEGGLRTEGWGDHCSPIELMGLFEAGKLLTFAENVPDD
jgi:hypothetical protein